tara:strand:- start:138 stop:473 length:336 start_codon:yes stop_codon:yes gene_type:complete
MIIKYEYEVRCRFGSTVDIDDEHKQLFKKENGIAIEQASQQQLHDFVNKEKIYHYDDMLEDSSYWARNIKDDDDMTLLQVRVLDEDDDEYVIKNETKLLNLIEQNREEQAQ